MKKLIAFGILIFLCGTAFTQIYTPVDPTIYGEYFNRVKTRYALHPPEKETLLTNTNDTTAQIFYNKADSSFWGWSEARGFFKLGAGGASGEGVIYTIEDNYDNTKILLLADNVPIDSLALVKADVYAKDPITITDTLESPDKKSYLWGIRKTWLDSLYAPTTYTAGPGISIFGTQIKLSDTVATATTGPRVIWNPTRAAFRAGYVHENMHSWRVDSLGLYSAAFGYASRAIGNQSFAAGLFSVARGASSFAVGLENIAAGNSSVVLGEYGYVTPGSTGNVVMGEHGIASGLYSIALGSYAVASADNAFALSNSTASGARSFAAGQGIATAFSSFAFGNQSTASGNSSTLFGNGLKAKHYAGMVIGVWNDSTNATSPTSFNLANKVFQIGVGTADGARANALEMTFDGRLTLNKYAGSSFTAGTAAWNLAVDASGNVMQVPVGGGGGSESTTASNGLTQVGDDIQLGGSLTSDINIEQSGNDFVVGDAGAGSEFRINGATNALSFNTPLAKTLRISDASDDVLLYYDPSANLKMDATGVHLTGPTEIIGDITGKGGFRLENIANSSSVILQQTGLTAARTFEFPDQSGTLALLSDIGGGGSYLPLAGGTLTGPLIQSANGAVSAPAISATGTWYTGGTTTTTKPYMLIEPTGAVSTTWSTSGTGLGVNAGVGFNGNLIDLQNNGASKFLVNSVLGYVFSPLNFVTTAAVSSTIGYRSSSVAASTVLGYTSITNHSAANLFLLDMASGTMTQTSGTNGGAYIHPTYNQVASTASNTDLRINRTETSVGSGTQYLIDAQVAGVSKFSVDRLGRTAIGTGAAATNTLDVLGTVKLDVSGKAEGAVLTSDVNGVATWQQNTGSRIALVDNSGTITNTGSTTENTVYTGTLTANGIGINGSYHITGLYSMTNNANAKTVRIKFNGTTVATYVLTASNSSMSSYTIIRNRGSLTSQISGPSLSNGNATFNSGSALNPTSHTFNTGADITVTITIQNAVGTDVATVEGIEFIANY